MVISKKKKEECYQLIGRTTIWNASLALLIVPYMHQRDRKNYRTSWIFICQLSWLCRAIPTDGVGQLLNKKIKSDPEGTLKGMGEGKALFWRK